MEAVNIGKTNESAEAVTDEKTTESMEAVTDEKIVKVTEEAHAVNKDTKIAPGRKKSSTKSE